LEAFPALRLGFEAAAAGGTAGAVLNAANETAVDRFLKSDLRFDQIPTVVEAVMRHHDFEVSPTIPLLLKADAWARKEAQAWTS
ncbi:MAG: 1-deoxy-D-xylulose-5-phosphate reductoisomerase, partial [Planctomycetaceae bacterium]|nr:1-deoxy-D-xylulose-5-phosphate reductoisomerase [Planctomycetaceae bacterium]